MRPVILIIDDEPNFVKKMRVGFSDYNFEEALTVQRSEQILMTKSIDLILLDLKLQPESENLDGLNYIPPLKTTFPDIPVVVVTADEKTDTVVTAMKKGADDFLRKSEFDLLSWKKKFELLIENKRLNQQLKNIESSQHPFLGQSSEIQEIKKTLQILAENPDVTVLITGETGVGKEVAARYLHQNSKRKNNPFVAVNLSSIQTTLLESTLFGHKKGAFTGANYDREGYFRKANGGILFLDEIGDIDQNIQIKLLRFLDTKKIQVVGDDEEIQLDLQIIAATNQDLFDLVNKDRFRTDLYYRLKNFLVEIPPLRHRKEDIQPIFEYYLKQAGYNPKEKNISKHVLQIIQHYHWPGNIRELKNAVENMLLKARILKKKQLDKWCLPPELQNSQQTKSVEHSGEQVDENGLIKQKAHLELSAIEDALRKTYGQKQAAAEMLGMNADQMRYRVLKWGKQTPDLLNNFPFVIKNYKLG